jgi:hypothetical protein
MRNRAAIGFVSSTYNLAAWEQNWRLSYFHEQSIALAGRKIFVAVKPRHPRMAAVLFTALADDPL